MDDDDLGPLFRMRSASVGSRFTRADLFHIPFERRDLVKPQRYSMLGIPMLYVGATTFVCWEEMGRPSFNDLWVSCLRLRPGKTVRVLNIGFRPATVASLLSVGEGQDDPRLIAVAMAVLWPLVAACAHRPRYPNAPFCEEYVIPQLLTRYLVENGEYDS